MGRGGLVQGIASEGKEEGVKYIALTRSPGVDNIREMSLGIHV